MLVFLTHLHLAIISSVGTLDLIWTKSKLQSTLDREWHQVWLHPHLTRVPTGEELAFRQESVGGNICSDDQDLFKNEIKGARTQETCTHRSGMQLSCMSFMMSISIWRGAPHLLLFFKINFHNAVCDNCRLLILTYFAWRTPDSVYS